MTKTHPRPEHQSQPTDPGPEPEPIPLPDEPMARLALFRLAKYKYHLETAMFWYRITFAVIMPLALVAVARSIAHLGIASIAPPAVVVSLATALGSVAIGCGIIANLHYAAARYYHWRADTAIIPDRYLVWYCDECAAAEDEDDGDGERDAQPPRFEVDQWVDTEGREYTDLDGVNRTVPIELPDGQAEVIFVDGLPKMACYSNAPGQINCRPLRVTDLNAGPHTIECEIRDEYGNATRFHLYDPDAFLTEPRWHGNE